MIKTSATQSEESAQSLRSETAAPGIESLPSTRRALLSQLKREGPQEAADLATVVGTSVPAVRQQLSRLEEDGLVNHRRESRGRGRPVHLYELSEDAEELFPKRYGDLTAELLGYLGGPEAEDVDRLFDKRRARRLSDARRRLEGLSRSEQVEELARILDADGYLADQVQSAEGRWRITEHNCAILSVARGYRQACTSEIAFIREALPWARVERVAHLMDGAHSCAYEITERVEGS